MMFVWWSMCGGCCARPSLFQPLTSDLSEDVSPSISCRKSASDAPDLLSTTLLRRFQIQGSRGPIIRGAVFGQILLCHSSLKMLPRSHRFPLVISDLMGREGRVEGGSPSARAFTIKGGTHGHTTRIVDQLTGRKNVRVVEAPALRLPSSCVVGMTAVVMSRARHGTDPAQRVRFEIANEKSTRIHNIFPWRRAEHDMMRALSQELRCDSVRFTCPCST